MIETHCEQFEVPRSVLQAELLTVTRNLKARVVIPGFRPGKAPLPAIERRLGFKVRDEVRTEVAKRRVSEALLDRGIVPVDAPFLDQIQDDGRGPLTFSATFSVLEDFDPGDFSQLTVERPAVVVADEAIKVRMEYTRVSAMTYELVDEPARVADCVRVIGRNGRHHMVEVGGTVAPEFEHVDFIGRRAMDDGWPKVTEVRRAHIPAFDELLQQLNLASMDMLRERVTEDLTAEASQAADHAVINAIADEMEAAVARCPWEIPESMVDRDLVDRGINPHPPEPEADEERRVIAHQRAESRRRVALTLVLEAIARQQNIRVSDADLDIELVPYVSPTRNEILANHSRALLRAELRRKRAMEFARSQVEVVQLEQALSAPEVQV